ncbi:hypothetical protein N7517_010032 [Penicillium concentricum]|uniref:Major facilitator superfamily (MFS) profile domain-containing protein n=1 Tax=Penicillium concentricum TaxID=293559 RepID=A0A9W9RIM8_9EURO|nr:uncharacterized protein N7517_010032 [Penicillium concentricum]KAJ5360841.1 hypothetical protein N7517_010032 [Penicillium concentricum]
MSKPASEHSEFAHSPTQDDLEEDEEFTFSLFVMGNIFALCFLVLAGAWSSTVPSSAIPFIAQRFPNEAGQAAWIAAAPSVMGAILQAIIGDLSDIFGRRAFLQAGCVVGTVGMIIGGRATSIKMLIGGQVLNGLGNASMFLASALAQEIVPKRQRPLLLAAITTVTSVSYICGPILEGVCIKQKVGGILEGWRIGFYIGAALWAITLAFITTLYHPMPRPNPEGLSIMQLLRKVDWLGIAFCSTGVTLFLVGLNYGGNPYSWDSAVVLGTLIPGLVVSLCFVLWEWKGTKTGLMHHDLFVDRNYVLTVYVRVVGGIALLGGQAYLPQVAASVFETDGLTTAVWQLPMTVSSMIGSVIAAFF